MNDSTKCPRCKSQSLYSYPCDDGYACHCATCGKHGPCVKDVELVLTAWADEVRKERAANLELDTWHAQRQTWESVEVE